MASGHGRAELFPPQWRWVRGFWLRDLLRLGRRAADGWGGGAGEMWISVARTEGSDALIRSLLREFVFNAIWVSPLLMLATLAIGIFAIRNGLKPVREISRMASSIGPDATSVRLPERNLPT